MSDPTTRATAACTVPCYDRPIDSVPRDATVNTGATEYWSCPKHGSHSGQRKRYEWERQGQHYGMWEWTNVT